MADIEADLLGDLGRPLDFSGEGETVARVLVQAAFEDGLQGVPMRPTLPCLQAYAAQAYAMGAARRAS